MGQRIAQLAVTVRDYDEALAFYVGKLGFECLEDTDLGAGKRWVRVQPRGSDGAGILLARAVTDAQLASVGRQAGGRVFLFLETDDFWRDYEALLARGVTFVRALRGVVRDGGRVRGSVRQPVRPHRAVALTASLFAERRPRYSFFPSK